MLSKSTSLLERPITNVTLVLCFQVPLNLRTFEPSDLLTTTIRQLSFESIRKLFMEWRLGKRRSLKLLSAKAEKEAIEWAAEEKEEENKT